MKTPSPGKPGRDQAIKQQQRARDSRLFLPELPERQKELASFEERWSFAASERRERETHNEKGRKNSEVSSCVPKISRERRKRKVMVGMGGLVYDLFLGLNQDSAAPRRLLLQTTTSSESTRIFGIGIGAFAVSLLW